MILPWRRNKVIERDAQPVLGPTQAAVWDYPYASIYPTRRPGQPTPTTMRHIAETADVVAACIAWLIRSASVVPLRVVGPDAGEAEDLLQPWGGIGGEGNRRARMEAIVLRDVLTIGYGAVWISGEDRRALPLDAATIHPRLTERGELDPEMPYEQRVGGSVVTRFGPNEIWVDGLYPQSRGPEYISPVAMLIDAIEALQALDEYRRAYLTHGDVPTRLLSVPDRLGREAVDTFLRSLHQRLQGPDRHRLIAVPEGCQILPAPEPETDWSGYERSLIHRICAVYGVSPAAIGYEGDLYKSSQETAVDSTLAWGLTPLLALRADMYSAIFASFGLDARAENGATDDVDQPQDEDRERVRRWIKRAKARIRRGRSPACDPPEPLKDKDLEATIRKRLNLSEIRSLGKEYDL